MDTQAGQPDFVAPDYRGGSIVNLMASIAAACGVPETGYPPLADLDPTELAEARHVVLLVVDGLGYHYLKEHGSGSALQAHLRRPLSSVFPPTTASAITTYHTGVAPQQHAQTGWFTYYRSLGAIITTLPLRPRFGGADLAAAGIGAEVLFHYPALFQRLRRPAHVVVPRFLVDSPYTRLHSAGAERHGFEGLDGLFGTMTALVRGARQPCYVFGYWPKLDSTAHEHGIGSAAAAAELAAIDRGWARFLETIAGTGTVVLVCADHGFVDITPGGVVHLDDHPELAACLRLPLCGEPRAAYCYLRPGTEDTFLGYVDGRLRHALVPRRSLDLVSEGWFGLGEPDPRLLERIGDYTLLLGPGYVLKDAVPGEKPFKLVGVHGGASPAEMTVPLVVAQP